MFYGGSMMGRSMRKMLNKQVVKFFVTGLMAAVTEYGSFFILIQLDTPAVAANVLSFLSTLVVGFMMQKYWVFKAGNDARRQLIHYAMLASINLVISSTLIWLMVDILSVAPLIAKLIIMALIAASNYLLLSKIIFR